MIVEEERVSTTPAFASITSLVPDWAVSSRVTAFSTTRLGGVSQPPYNSLNLGLHVNDEPAAVEENRRRLQDSFALPECPNWLNQTHSPDVIHLSGSNTATRPYNADGAWTTTVDTVVAVLTADCLPVIIANTQGAQVAVIHAGWRGLAAGILDNALAAFDSQSAIHAWMGPAIGASAFEVGEDVLQAFVQRNVVHESAFTPRQTPGKYLADLYGLARTELSAKGNVTVTGGDYCTYSQAEWFHSYRRDGVNTGRMATVAWISKG